MSMSHVKVVQRKVCSFNPNDIQSLLEQQGMQLRQEGVEATGKDQVLLPSLLHGSRLVMGLYGYPNLLLDESGLTC